MKDEENDSQGILVLKENEFWAFFSSAAGLFKRHLRCQRPETAERKRKTQKV